MYSLYNVFIIFARFRLIAADHALKGGVPARAIVVAPSCWHRHALELHRESLGMDESSKETPLQLCIKDTVTE